MTQEEIRQMLWKRWDELGFAKNLTGWINPSMEKIFKNRHDLNGTTN